MKLATTNRTLFFKHLPSPIKILTAFRYVRKLSLYKTILFNFRFFPFRDAVKLPVFILKGTTLKYTKNAKLNIKCKIRPGLLWFGALDINWTMNDSNSYIMIDGRLTICESVRFGYDTKLIIAQNAKASFGGKTVVNHNTSILCHNSIDIGYGVRIGWNSQICDTAFHYISVDSVVTRKAKPIRIGREAWVSSYCNIGRGAVLPDYSILSTCSLLNKDFSSAGTHLLIAGIPAKVIKTNVYRIMEFIGDNGTLCDKIDNYFEQNPGEIKLNLADLD